ncbi:MAG: HAMP domain-containing protein [Labilithrix sp.]|nr:HAMP domain-containing protein [Labilithrix sp.]
MRLTVRLVVWFFLCVVFAVGINGYLAVRSELERFESDAAARHVVIGLVLRAAFAEVMDTDGEARAVSVLDYTDKHIRLVDIRWVHLEVDAPEDRKPNAPLAKLAPLRADQEVHDKADGKLFSYVPVHIEGRPLSALELSASLDGERTVVRDAILREVRAVATVAIAVGIAAALLGIFLVGRPMRRIVEHARRIGKGDLSPMPASPRRDEISELGREMNAMCAQLADAQEAKLVALDQLRRAERLSTVGKLASGLAHELGTPLNVITLRAKAIAQGRAAGPGAQEAAKSIGEQTSKMTNLVRQLLDFARRKAPHRDVVNVEELAKRTADLVETVAAKSKVRFDVRVGGGVPKVQGDASQLEQVLTNLFVNAIHAMPGGGAIHVATTLVTKTPPADHGGKKGSWIEISVRDEGNGITEETLPHIFEPFFTTKDVGEGTGLGLAVCYGIVRDHGGWIDVKTAVREGTTFAVYLPKELS